MSRADDIMLTAEEIRLRRRKRRRIVIIILLLIALGAAGLFGARPVAGLVRGWQARRHAERAFAFINKEQWDDARTEAVAAYQLRRTEPQALRAVARFLSRTHQPDALEFWTQLEKIDKLTREDLRDEATIAMLAAENERAETAVRELIGSTDAGPADWLLAAQLAIQKNLRDDAHSYVEKIAVDPSATEREQLQATALQLALAGDDMSARANALARLKKLAQGTSAESLDALVVLAQTALSSPAAAGSEAAKDRANAGGTHAAKEPQVEVGDQKSASGSEEPPARREVSGQDSEVSGQSSVVSGQLSVVDLVQALQNHPLAKVQHKLLALDLLLHAGPAQREEIVARAINDWKNAGTPDLVALAAWLNGKSEFQKTLDTIPLEKALQSRDLFLQQLDALAGLDRWSEVKQLLGNEKFPLDSVVQQMYLARCSAQLGEKAATQNYWQRALEAAGSDLQKLFTLAEYAEKNGNAAIAEAAYDDAAKVSPKLRIAQQARLRLAHATGNTKKMHSVLVEMRALWPNDSAIQNDEAYTRLLLWPADSEEAKREAAAVEQIAEKLVEREPASLPHRTLLALARLRRGRAEDALNVYGDLRVAPNIITGSALAVHAAILAATAHAGDAKTEAKQIKPEQLLPEERALVEHLLEEKTTNRHE